MSKYGNESAKGDIAMECMFIVKGKPVGKARPRVTSHGTYTPAATRKKEAEIRWEYASTGAHRIDGPVSMTVHAYYPIPKSFSKKKREMALKGQMLPTAKPDLDNVVKLIQDALNSVAYIDDSQIVELRSSKCYSPDDDEGAVIVTIKSIEIVEV